MERDQYFSHAQNVFNAIVALIENYDESDSETDTHNSKSELEEQESKNVTNQFDKEKFFQILNHIPSQYISLFVCYPFGIECETLLHKFAKFPCEYWSENFQECLISCLQAANNKNPQDIYGNTPLHYVVQYNSFEYLLLFLMHGGNPLITNHDGDLPIHILALRFLSEPKDCEYYNTMLAVIMYYSYQEDENHKNNNLIALLQQKNNNGESYIDIIKKLPHLVYLELENTFNKTEKISYYAVQQNNKNFITEMHEGWRLIQCAKFEFTIQTFEYFLEQELKTFWQQLKPQDNDFLTVVKIMHQLLYQILQKEIQRQEIVDLTCQFNKIL